MKNRIRIARGTSEELRQSTAKAELGVPFYDTTNKRLYIGKGTKDTDPMLKDYTEDDSIVAYMSENATNAKKAIFNTTNNTYSGFYVPNDYTLRIDTVEDESIEDPSVPVRINILSDELVASPDVAVYADLTQDVNIGDIIEIEYTTRLTTESSGQRYSSKFIKLKVDGKFDGVPSDLTGFSVQPIYILDQFNISDGQNGDLIFFQSVKFELVKNTSLQKIQKIRIYSNGVRFTSLLAPNNQGNVTSVVTSSVNSSLLVIKSIHKIIE